MKCGFAILESKLDWANGRDYVTEIRSGFKTRTEAEADPAYVKRLNDGRDVFVRPVK